MKKIVFIVLVSVIFTIITPMSEIEAGEKAYTYLDGLKPVKTGQYTGNEGDSFVYKIGKHTYTRGNTDINGKSYSHGLEAWVARWNYTAEKSWTYSVFNINKKYNSLEGTVVLINSYNTTDFDTTLYFYGDGKLLQKYEMTPSKFPFDIKVDVSGVKKLKVYVEDNEYVCGGTSFGITGCRLYRAAVPKTPKNISINRKSGIIKGITSKNVTVYAEAGDENYTAKSDSKGRFVIKIKKLKQNEKIKIYAKNKYKKSKIIEV